MMRKNIVTDRIIFKDLRPIALDRYCKLVVVDSLNRSKAIDQLPMYYGGDLLTDEKNASIE